MVSRRCASGPAALVFALALGLAPHMAAAQDAIEIRMDIPELSGVEGSRVAILTPADDEAAALEALEPAAGGGAGSGKATATAAAAAGVGFAATAAAGTAGIAALVGVVATSVGGSSNTPSSTR